MEAVYFLFITCWRRSSVSTIVDCGYHVADESELHSRLKIRHQQRSSPFDILYYSVNVLSPRIEFTFPDTSTACCVCKNSTAIDVINMKDIIFSSDGHLLPTICIRALTQYKDAILAV